MPVSLIAAYAFFLVVVVAAWLRGAPPGRRALNGGPVAIAREAPDRSRGGVTGSPFSTSSTFATLSRQHIADTMKPWE